MKSVRDILTLTDHHLRQHHIAQSRRQAELLVADILNMSRLDLYLNFDRPLTENELHLCREALKRRSRHEPLEYIKGEVAFYNCLFKVDPNVLIPRQETEILVDKVVSELRSQNLNQKIFWDLCCGSGCIGISVKCALPELHVVLSDISPEAVEIAKLNAKQNQTQVEILQGDFFAPFKGKQADFIACNPPYISKNEFLSLEEDVRKWEPQLALIGGETGLEYYAKMAAELKPFLKKKGKVWCELGFSQGKDVLNIFEMAGWNKLCVDQDWSGHDRFFSLENE
ncbi:MAG: peptide chain release factor N(5)-glutamine methyltransferase [Chlamydiales bacterium]